MKNVLFLSYDGLTDPLGQSQILPYIIGLSSRGYRFSILSFEKKERFSLYQKNIHEICDRHNIEWIPLSFTTFPPFVSKLWDLYRMKRRASIAHVKRKFSLIHCRSYLSASAGVYLKKKFGVKYLFDMRGFWVDERVDGGLWNLRNPFFRIVYNIYKKKEAKYIRMADHIVSLTMAAASEIQRWPAYDRNPITIVPCSADFDIFALPNAEQRMAAREALGLNNHQPVLVYLGSIGTWYLMKEMMDFFRELLELHPDSRFLIITPDDQQIVRTYATMSNVKTETILIRRAQRKELHALLSAADAGLMFIKESYSKLASSPTKLGELLAMGIPVICNGRVGDVAQIMSETKGGVIVDQFTPEEYRRAIQKIPALLVKDRNVIRNKAYNYYNLTHAIDTYQTVYQQLIT